MKAGLPFTFLILFIVLGPVGLLPVFAAAARRLPAKDRLRLALRSAGFAALAVLAVALAAAAIRQGLGAAWGALSVAAGLVLLAPALQLGLAGIFRTSPMAPVGGGGPRGGPALSPLAIPLIVGPCGVAAILLFLVGHAGETRFHLEVGGMLAAVLAIDLVAMLAAGPILRVLTPRGLRLIGWVLVIVQGGFAVEAIVTPLTGVLQDQADAEDEAQDAVMTNASTARPPPVRAIRRHRSARSVHLAASRL